MRPSASRKSCAPATIPNTIAGRCDLTERTIVSPCLLPMRRSGLLPALRDFLVEQDVGFLQFQHTWAKDSAYIALALGKPKYRSVVDRIGWHSSERRFMFPKFSITHMGEVKSDGSPILVNNPPAANLMEPYFRPFMRDELDALCANGHEVSMFWAMGASILHNLLAPAMNHKPAGIVLDGEGAQVAGPVLAKAMGCVELDLRRPARGQSVLERINAVGSQHGWPTVLSVPVGRLTQVSADGQRPPAPKTPSFRSMSTPRCRWE